uniref:SCP domain-containing protein n=1 Tax=Ananas comosus var. bracteatus TaxID=296719 RepID=A0A6V7P1Q9_ANACO|nr:unnamed protein product [Ananas comosus var. bracteatus]
MALSISPYCKLVLAILSVSAAATTLCLNTDTTDNTKPDSIGRASTTNAEFLSTHNAARQQAYAVQRRGDCQLVHSPGYTYGENIFWGQGHRWTAAEAVGAWVAENQWYHYDNNSCSGPDCSHYTQVVWRTTEQLGCAKITCATGDTFVVCEYYPPGNYIGARPYKKKPVNP